MREAKKAQKYTCTYTDTYTYAYTYMKEAKKGSTYTRVVPSQEKGG